MWIGIAGDPEAIRIGELRRVVFGAGLRLFDQLGNQPIELEQLQVVEGTGVTHVRYRVVK